MTRKFYLMSIYWIFKTFLKCITCFVWEDIWIYTNISTYVHIHLLNMNIYWTYIVYTWTFIEYSENFWLCMKCFGWKNIHTHTYTAIHIYTCVSTYIHTCVHTYGWLQIMCCVFRLKMQRCGQMYTQVKQPGRCQAQSPGSCCPDATCLSCPLSSLLTTTDDGGSSLYQDQG